MDSAFWLDFIRYVVMYVPLMAGTYVSFLILRYPDLTLEASWSLGGIVACVLVGHVPPIVAPLAGLLIGAVCGSLTSVIFVTIGRAKLLAGLLSYYILEAVGFHLLGDKASIFLRHSVSSFGFPDNAALAFTYYAILSALTLAAIRIWQRSRFGVSSRLVGENPRASLFFGLSINKHFASGLILSNAIVGLGGGLWAVNYGQASNVQGIGLVIKAFLALLLGHQLLLMIRRSKRAEPLTILVGTAVFVLLTLVSQLALIRIGAWSQSPIPWFRDTDKQVILAMILILALRLRDQRTGRKGVVSEW